MSTASRALNDKPDVARATRERVLAAAQELNYTADAYARTLVGGRSRMLGLIIPNNGDSFFAQLARGVADAATARGYGMIIYNTNECPELELQAHRLMLERRVEGVLVASVESGIHALSRLIEAGVCCVLLNRRLEGLDLDYVISDYEDGAYQATAHLCRLGHTCIAHVTLEGDRYSVRTRLAGYRHALEEYGVRMAPELVVRCSPELASVYERVLQALPALSPRPTAIFAYNDLQCTPILKALRELDWAVPGDMALVGYDDAEFAAWLSPPLTTVSQSPYDVGMKGAELLIEGLEQSDERSSEPRQLVLKPQLVIRQSSGPPAREERVK
ncbi:MAG: LacI family DNA-binding transcriptional regulator [Anaerolineae bacterium]|nr:LacI family DNA-binding transcriptional regulator [Anaerolineae bacterium]